MQTVEKKAKKHIYNDSILEILGLPGSCMTNIGHFRATAKLLEASGESIPTRLWLAPPAKMDEQQLMEEGVYNIYAGVGAHTEMPGCSLGCCVYSPLYFTPTNCS
jgi:aconitase B